MDVILASSRGEGLEELIRPKHPSPNHLFIRSTCSANLHLLTTQAIDIISKSKNPSNHHIYIIGGYCDLNEIIQHKIAIHRNVRYLEFVFVEQPEAAVSRITGRLETTSQIIANHNAKPILYTIPSPSLHAWNYTRLLQHKTAMLEHFRQYPSMQQHMIKSPLTINTNIIGINKKYGSYTPKLADTIIKEPGVGRNIGYISVGWGMGCIRHSPWRRSGPIWFLKPSKSIAQPSPPPTSNPSPLLPHRTPTPTLSMSIKERKVERPHSTGTGVVGSWVVPGGPVLNACVYVCVLLL